MGRLNNNQPHTLEILRVAEGQKSPQRDEDVQASWRRCLNEHQLDPTRYEGVRIVTQQELRHHRQESEELLCMARHGMEDLYRRVNAMGYILLLTNAQRLAIDTIGDADLDRELRHAGLIAGSEWHERHVGTNGVGACLMTGREIIVHRTDHFDMTLIPLSCTAVPIHDTQGTLIGVLDLSHLQAPQDKMSQALTLEVMKSCVRRIEMANLVRTHRQDWILRLHPSAEFLDVDPMAAIAIGTDGRIRGMTHNAHKLLLRSLPDSSDVAKNHTSITDHLVGRTFSDLFAFDPEDLPKLSRSRGNGDGMIELHSGEITFARSVPPVAAIKQRVINPLPAPLKNIHGGDPALQKLAERASKLVDRQISVILRGETGTGKEFIARAMHMASQRRGPFIAINCAALPESLIESELFGHTANAFTGASGKGKKGLIRESHGGTLFLDEIGDMPAETQTRLLRVLADGEFYRVGGHTSVKVDVRIIAATHQDLEERVQRGDFREDLFHRLNVIRIHIPRLAERREDIPRLMKFFFRKAAEELGGEPKILLPDTERFLVALAWPGNVRQLENTCRWLTVMASGREIHLRDLPPELGKVATPVADGTSSQWNEQLGQWARKELQQGKHHILRQAVPMFERAMIEVALAQTQGRKRDAAELLGWGRNTLTRKMKDLDMSD